MWTYLLHDNVGDYIETITSDLKPVTGALVFGKQVYGYRITDYDYVAPFTFKVTVCI